MLVRCVHSHDPFHRIFTGITAHASALYGDAWRTADTRGGPHPRHPRGDSTRSDPYVVTAMTPWPPSVAEAVVELHIHHDDFGPAAFAALPILLTHECVCHVPARQDRASNDSTFAEGLLDWVAYVFHEQWAGQARRRARTRRPPARRRPAHRPKSAGPTARRGAHDGSATRPPRPSACGSKPAAAMGRTRASWPSRSSASSSTRWIARWRTRTTSSPCSAGRCRPRSRRSCTGGMRVGCPRAPSSTSSSAGSSWGTRGGRHDRPTGAGRRRGVAGVRARGDQRVLRRATAGHRRHPRLRAPAVEPSGDERWRVVDLAAVRREARRGTPAVAHPRARPEEGPGLACSSPRRR